MRNKIYIWLAVGAILFALVIVAVYWPKSTQDGKAENVVYGSVLMPEVISQFAADGENGIVNIKPDKGIGQLPVGEYHSRLWRTEREDDQGNTWVLTGQS
ncbi:MAG: hypothetical protein HQ580_17795, partial [Planctomycetes bacterium]|nr:hypothetical protein [Planctomycetota bacterium]